MKTNLLIVLAFCCLAFGCDDDAEKVTLLNFNVVDPAQHSARRWLYASNANGDVLAMDEITTKGEFSLRGAISGQQVDIGYVMMYPSLSGDKKNWTFIVFKGIEVGSSVEVGRIFPSSATAGTALVRVINYNEPVSALSNLVYSATFSGGIKSLNVSGNVVDAELNLGVNSSEVLITAMRANTPVYFKKQQVTPGAIIEADFSTFVPMENIQVLDFSGVTSTAGFKSAEPNSYYYNFENTRATASVPTTGMLAYVPGYDDYQTLISNTEQADGVNMRSFLKRGSQATAFTFPDVSISVNNTDLPAFDAAISMPYTFKTSTFSFSEGEQRVTLSVYSNNEGSSSFKDFPGEFKKMDAALKVNDLSYSHVRFVSSDNTYTISDELRGMLSNTAPQKPFEMYSYTNVK
jgi:hypothetical protein